MAGPWHVPCSRAYLVFRSKGEGPEWLEFGLEAERAGDREDSKRGDCLDNGRNYADLEMQ